MKVFVKLLIFILFLIFLFSFFYEKGMIGGNKDKVTIKIGEVEVMAFLAKTNKERERGLSGVEKLEENEGMLFLFPLGVSPSFWMKDMLFSIDIIWIDKDKNVVEITENISPESYPTSIVPNKEVKYVLEVRSGFAEEKRIRVGDKLILKNNL